LGLMAAMGGVHVIKGVAHAVAALLVMAGVWMLTGQDPMFLAAQRSAARRARILAGVSMGIWLVLGFFALATGPEGLIRFLTYVVLAVQVVLGWELASFCRYLALRVPDDGLAWSVYTAACTVALYCFLFTGIRLLGWNDPLFVLVLTWPFPLTPVLTFLLMWCAWVGFRLGVAIYSCAKEGEDRVEKLVNPRKVEKYQGGIDL
jgi:hypothetical protein